MNILTPVTINNKFILRPAIDADFESIYQIYLEGIANSFDTDSLNITALKTVLKNNFDSRTDILNFWVAEDFDKNILGWSSLIKGSHNPTKTDYVAESSTYIAEKYRNFKGVGYYVFEHVIKMADFSNLKYIFAYASEANASAVKSIKRVGFIEAGILPPSPKDNFKENKLILVKILQ